MKIGVIMGGTSSERDISLNTGKEICKHLDKSKYEVCPIILDSKEELMDKIKGIDLAFLALHGQFGEDGTIQGILETLEIPYTGCGVLSSAICMDKDITKHILKSAGIPTPKWHMVRSIDEVDPEAIEDMGFPVIVKPNSGGSSIATARVMSREQLKVAVAEALQVDKEAMIEQYVKGEEITCPILNGRMLPVLAIKPKASFFDYTSKYTDGGADEYVVELNPELHAKVESIAVKSYKLLKCSVYARVDILIENGMPYVLEVNTLPGMTANSLFPKSALAAGISFGELLDRIIEYSLEERG